MPANSKGTNAGLLYVGIKGTVLALRKDDGEVAWTTRLRRGSSFVPIVEDGDRIYAVSGGEVSCLDSTSGDLLWHNSMKGLGTGYAALAGGGFPTAGAALEEAARAATARHAHAMLRA
jgi:outer membrane protein assembly factor BamB